MLRNVPRGANANQTRGIDSKEGLPPDLTSRAVDEYLEILNNAAFGAATDAIPKYVSPVDPAARWTGADGGAAYFAYSTNYLVDVDNAVIVDVKPTAPIRPAEARAARDMIDRVQARFGIKPGKLVVHEAARDIARDIPKTDAYMTSFLQRRKVEMLFAHLKRYIGLRTMRLRGPKGATEQFQLAATAQILRKLAKLVPVPAPS